MNALLHPPTAPAAFGRHRAVPAKAAAPPANVADKPRKPLRAPRLVAAVAVFAAHAAPLALGLPFAAVPLVVGGLGIAAIVLSRWSR
jgi:hypothetical protein